ncbi:MAG TPA: hypothetical protein GX401_09740, partial [Clostridiales bacterium]|nr:hypothetical protein [Clostridiales bacterium]
MTGKATSSKKLLSIILSTMLFLSMVSTGMISTAAATMDSEEKIDGKAIVRFYDTDVNNNVMGETKVTANVGDTVVWKMYAKSSVALASFTTLPLYNNTGEFDKSYSPID